MCLDMSSEIEQFDYQKELEMQQILVEYSERRCRIYEQVSQLRYGQTCIIFSKLLFYKLYVFKHITLL